MAARPEWILGAVIFLFGVGAPGSSAVDLPSGPRSQFLGAVVRGLPSPESELRRLRKLLIMKFDLVCCKVVAMTTQDGGSCGAKLRRLPGHAGTDPPWVKGVQMYTQIFQQLFYIHSVYWKYVSFVVVLACICHVFLSRSRSNIELANSKADKEPIFSFFTSCFV